MKSLNSKILKEVFLRSNPDKPNLVDAAANVLDIYYDKIYVGSEHRLITKMYFDSIFWELADWMARNIKKIEAQNKDGEEVKINTAYGFFKEKIQRERIKSYDIRKNYYFNWLNGEDKINNELSQYLTNRYTKKDKHIVKKELDIHLPKDVLEVNYKRICKNA